MDGGKREVVDKIDGHDIGVHASENESGETIYQLTGEFYRTGWYNKEKELADKINQQYAVRKIKKEMELSGYQMSENMEYAADTEGNITIKMVCYQ
jgi:hypothetical protein